MEPQSPPAPNRLYAASTMAIRLQFALQLLIGIYLSLIYSPTVAGAHRDVIAMHSGGLGRFLQGMHYWGSSVLILHSLAQVVVGVWCGFYKPPETYRYIESILSLGAALGFQMSGNLLPFDRHGVQTASIESSIAARIPFVGAPISHVALGGASFSARTLQLWFGAHVYILAVIVFAAWAIGMVGRKKWALEWVAFTPILLVAVTAIAVPSPLGSVATSTDFGAFDARVSWYVWPLHGTMRMFDSLVSGSGWIGAVALPGIFIFALLALAVLSVGKRAIRISTKVSRAILGSFGTLFAAGGIFFGGGIAPLTGTRDPVSAPVSTQPASPVDKALAESGRKLFNSIECADCHGQDGAKGSGGPSLTAVWQTHGDADFYMRYIKNPVSVQSDSTMPSFPKIKSDQLRELAEFLRMPK